jgi:hypothetical protein
MANKERDRVLRKKQVIKTLPASLKRAFDKPRLRELTFNDLNTVYTQMQKYFDLDGSAFTTTSCSICTKWRG